MKEGKKAQKITTKLLLDFKESAEKISMLTAYDFSMAKLIDAAGIDVILVGDSASNVICGNDTTIPITLENMIYHAKNVSKGTKRALVVTDLPFGSYQGNSSKALKSAIRVMKESGTEAIKMEGGKEIVSSIKKIIASGIPVMGHLGLTPQSINAFGSYKVRAESLDEAEKLLADAKKLEKAGCFALVLEKIPAVLAKKVTQSLTIPTIGIGAGSDTDGQVLVLHDMLGITKDFSPKFIRRYDDLSERITAATSLYIQDIKQKKFPDETEQY